MSEPSAASSPSASAAWCNPPGMPDDLLPYRLWVSHGGLVRTAGLVAMDYTTGAPASHTDFVVQVRATMDNLRMVLGHAGTSLDQVLETRCYVHDMGRWDEMNAHLPRVLRRSPPGAHDDRDAARSAVPVRDLGGGRRALTRRRGTLSRGGRAGRPPGSSGARCPLQPPPGWPPGASR